MAADVSLHGFVQGNYSLNTAGDNPDGKDFKWSEERAQIKLEATAEPFRLFIKGDAFHDNIDKHSMLELREGYADYTSEKWDARVGRQVITWGVGDLLFINDIFPKDYEAFFSGRPMEYLKKALTAQRSVCTRDSRLLSSLQSRISSRTITLIRPGSGCMIPCPLLRTGKYNILIKT